jgi:hypothetical protein
LSYIKNSGKILKVYTNILDFVPCAKKVMNYAKKARFIRHKAKIRQQALCAVHRRRCQLPSVQLAVGGSPCVDYSRAGLRRGLGGTQMPPETLVDSFRPGPIQLDGLVFLPPAALWPSKTPQ